MPGELWREGHPSREELNAFLLGGLERSPRLAVLRHLIQDCATCREVMAPLAEAMFYPWRLPADLPESGAEKCDFVIRRTIAEFCRRVREQEQGKEMPVPAPLPSVEQLLAEVVPPQPLRGEETWASCEALLAESWELRREDPEGMIGLAMAAVLVAESIDPATRGPQALADLQCRALAALANARRAADEPWLAASDFASALQSFDRGSGEPLLLARLMDLTVSLFREHQRFQDAESLSRWAFGLYLRHGENHAAGRLLVKRAWVTLAEGKPQDGLELAHRSLELIDLAREPHLTLAALHNFACAYADCGKFEEADRVLWQARPLYAAEGGPLDRLRLVWLEGRIAAGRGRHGRAERSFRQARDGFLAHKLFYTAAVAALDLGVLLLQRGRTAEARALVLETVDTFTFYQIEREANMALLLLTEAARQDRLTITILKSAAADLAKIQK
ncbi:MAG TPA: tetratricopeptide repeat protein [Thermoanaerobaculia bacterium]|nr:tetratricopeptide repeat protein [Thermoanaerobaculia bacterium]